MSDSQITPAGFAALISKYDAALTLYDDLAKDINQMKKATQVIRKKTLKLLETKVRRKRALSIQSEALDVILAAGVKAQQRRKGGGPRRSRRRESTATISSPAKSPVKGALVKRRASKSDHPGHEAMVTAVHNEPVILPLSAHSMSTRLRSAAAAA